MAKSLLTNKGIEFEEIYLGNDVEKMMELAKKTGMKTVPQIFIGDQLIGGYDDLKSMNDSGKLDEILNN
jgi:glutaredoxin 3